MEAVNIAANLVVQDYSKNYGGINVLIDGRECSFSSVVGYALYNNEDPVEAVVDCMARMVSQPYNGHKLVWVSVSSVCICSDPGFYDRKQAARDAMPKLSVGDVVKFEGNLYEIIPANNKNYALKKINAQQ